MKHLFYITIFILTLISCRKDHAAQIVDGDFSLSDFFEINREKGTLYFTIDPGHDTIIRDYPFLFIEIDTNTFMDANGQLLSDSVVVSVKGIQDKRDMILSGVPTVSNGYPLITGGQMKISAETQNGEIVTINPNKPLKVNFTMNSLINSDTLMSLFLMDEIDNEVNWQSASSLGIDSTVVMVLGPAWGGYSFFLITLDYPWVNCDYFPPMPSTDISAELDGISDVDEITCFIYYKDLSVVTYLGPDPLSQSGFSALGQVIGEDVIIVALAKKGNQYFQSFSDHTIQPGMHANIDLVPTTLSQFELAVDALP